MTREPGRDLSALKPTDEPVSREARRAEEAHLYARLLVSDIRLYHEEEVLIGRAEGDLLARLRSEIAAAHGAYLCRFEDEQTFDAELVRILAGGDPARLGE